MVIPLTGFSRKIFVLARKELALSLPRGGFARGRTSRYAAQANAKIDTARACPGPDPGAEKGPFRTDTNLV